MWTEEKLESLLAEPTPELVEDMKRIRGDILLLGAGGKIGPGLALMAAQAIRQAGSGQRVLAVSRFTEQAAADLLRAGGVETISCDLLADGALEELPDAPNVIYLAGRKFGTQGAEHLTWAANAALPALVARRYRDSNIVVFSSGNIYPRVAPHSGGATEATPPEPLGEYAMSCLARERIFEHAAAEYGTRALLLRLNYAVDLRYGVLCDIASEILADRPVSLAPATFNCVWQGYVNEVTIRALLHAQSPARILNITGPETVSVRHAATRLGALLERRVEFTGVEGDRAFLNNAGECFSLFGYPKVGLEELIRWQAEWLRDGGRLLGKPTHFEEQGGKF